MGSPVIDLKSFSSKSKKQNKEIDIDEDSKSLFCLSSKSGLRRHLKMVIENPYFENFIYHMIALNSLLLALDEPILSDAY